MRAWLGSLLLIPAVACDPDPAELRASLAEPVTASAQYFHGNCFAGFSMGLDFRIEETRGVGVVLTRLSYRITDQGAGLVLSDENLDRQDIDLTYGERASVLPANGSRSLVLAAVSSARPQGPMVVTGTIEALDENDQRVAESYQLSAALVVNDPGPPGGGACSSGP